MVKIKLVIVRLFPTSIVSSGCTAEGMLLEVAVSGFSRPDICGYNWWGVLGLQIGAGAERGGPCWRWSGEGMPMQFSSQVLHVEYAAVAAHSCPATSASDGLLLVSTPVRKRRRGVVGRARRVCHGR